MVVFPFLAVGFVMNVVAGLFLVCAVVLVLMILVQKGRGGGLGGVFGGGMASGLLGSKTGDFLTWATIVLVGMFLTLAVVLAKFYRPTISEFGSESVQETAVPQKQPASQELPTSSQEASTGEEPTGAEKPPTTSGGEGGEANLPR